MAVLAVMSVSLLRERTVSTDRQHRAVYRPARGAEPYHPTDSLCSLQSLSCTDFFFCFPIACSDLLVALEVHEASFPVSLIIR